MLGNLASLYKETGKLEPAERNFAESIAISRSVGNHRAEGISLGNLGILLMETGRRELAERNFTEALAIHREVRNQRFEGTHLCTHAVLLLERGRVEPARKAWLQGARLLRELGDTQALLELTADMEQACARAGVKLFEADPS